MYEPDVELREFTVSSMEKKFHERLNEVFRVIWEKYLGYPTLEHTKPAQIRYQLKCNNNASSTPSQQAFIPIALSVMDSIERLTVVGLTETARHVQVIMNTVLQPDEVAANDINEAKKNLSAAFVCILYPILAIADFRIDEKSRNLP